MFISFKKTLVFLSVFILLIISACEPQTEDEKALDAELEALEEEAKALEEAENDIKIRWKHFLDSKTDEPIEK